MKKIDAPINAPRHDKCPSFKIKLFSSREARLANIRRDELLRNVSRKASCGFARTKIHTGRLSRGCLICGQGYWSCLFINGLCTAHCFFCPQDRKIKRERLPFEHGGIQFENAEQYADFLSRFGFRGVGFSGGEAFLAFGRLQEYIEVIRRKLGSGVYLWVYTNGDLVNEEKLRRLKMLGLNEIRFNISARNYDLDPVALAVKFIDTVTIEIPAIPEDYRRLAGKLKAIQMLGVKHLNIHQLTATSYNYKNYLKRGYTFIQHPGIPIFESEICALKLMWFAIRSGIRLPIQYCSAAYQSRFQAKGLRERWAPLLKENYDEITACGYVRRFVVRGSPSDAKRISGLLQRKGCLKGLWGVDKTGTEIALHRSILKLAVFEGREVDICYFVVQASRRLSSDGTGKEIKLRAGKRLFAKRKLVARYVNLSSAALAAHRELFLEDGEEGKVLRRFFMRFPSDSEGGFPRLKKEAAFLNEARKWERVRQGLPQIC